MKSFNHYITEAKTVKVNRHVAYWQPSKSSKVEIGTTVGAFKGRPRWEEVENVFEKERPRGLPSRLGNIYVAATEDNILFNKSKPVYEVQITGKAFYANLEHFTEGTFAKNDDQVKDWANEYWKGVNSNDADETTEIILDGEAEVSYKL